MEKYIECKDITAHMKIFTKPMTKSMRYSIIKELDMEQKKEAEDKVFLSKDAYPPNRGRPPKYDFLYVFVSDIEEASAEKVKKLLQDKTGRSVFYFSHTWRELRGYAFLLPWRSPVDGKALPNKLKFFDELRKEIIKELEERNISSYGKIQEKEEKEEHPEEPKQEPMPVVEQVEQKPEPPAEDEDRRRKREELMADIEFLKKKRERLKKELSSVEMRGRFTPGYLSKKKKLKKEIEELNLKIQELKVKWQRI